MSACGSCGDKTYRELLDDNVRVRKERDEARAELDFIKAEYSDADDASLTRDALLLRLRLLESEMDAERASRRVYERAHDDILEALKRAAADAYHPEDGEPVALWGVERLAKERDEARKYAEERNDEANNLQRHLNRAAQERDEARAEVERLRGVAMHPTGVTWEQHHLSFKFMVRDELNATEAAAYQRGAEAMREAAAKEVFAFYAWSKDNEATRTDIKNLAEMIDALPVAKDKP